MRPRTGAVPSAFSALALATAASPAPAQVAPGGDIAHTVVFEGNSDTYALKSLAVGFPGLILTVANASVVPAGGVGLGVLGVGLGVGQIALAFEQPRYGQYESAVIAINAVAGVAGILAGLWQIRATHALDPPSVGSPEDADDTRAFSISAIPGLDRAGVLLAWRW